MIKKYTEEEFISLLENGKSINSKKIEWTPETCFNLLMHRPSLMNEHLDKFTWLEYTSIGLIYTLPETIHMYLDKLIWTEKSCIALIKRRPELIKKIINKFVWSEEATEAFLSHPKYKHLVKENLNAIPWNKNISLTIVKEFPNIISLINKKLIWSKELSEYFLGVSPQMLTNNMHKFVWSKYSILYIAEELPHLLDPSSESLIKEYAKHQEFNNISIKEFKKKYLLLKI